MPTSTVLGARIHSERHKQIPAVVGTQVEEAQQMKKCTCDREGGHECCGKHRAGCRKGGEGEHAPLTSVREGPQRRGHLNREHREASRCSR